MASTPTAPEVEADCHVLVVNLGSSSLKYQLVDPQNGVALALGLVERLGSDDADLRHRVAGRDDVVLDCPGVGPHEALDLVLRTFAEYGPDLTDLVAIAHRVVHGGPSFTQATIIDDAVVDRIRELIPLARLHNPVNLDGIEAMRSLRPDLAQVAVFDTSFHAGLPPAAATYPLPATLRRRWPIRRYGFHGSSVAFVTTRTAQLLGRDVGELRLIVCHLGNGASVTAVDRGRSVDTSMGFTPLEGLMMGTRIGDLDASIPQYLQREAGMTVDEVDTVLTRESGLLGVAGVGDMREVRRRASEGDADADLALAIYRHRLRHYIGAFLAVMPGTDAVVFTGGIGENDVRLRAEVVDSLSHLGLSLDPEANSAATGGAEPLLVDDRSSPIRVAVVPTNEELQIAREAIARLDASTTSTH